MAATRPSVLLSTSTHVLTFFSWFCVNKSVRNHYPCRSCLYIVHKHTQTLIVKYECDYKSSSETHQHFSSALGPVVLHKSFHVYGTPSLRCFAAKSAPLPSNSQSLTWHFGVPDTSPIIITFTSFEINAFGLQQPQSETLKAILCCAR